MSHITDSSLPLADPAMILVIRVQIPNTKIKPFICYRDYKNIYYVALLANANIAPWDKVGQAVSVDDKVDTSLLS